MGNGSKTKMWKDTWLGNEPLCSRFNRIFHLDVDPDCFVADRRSNNSWLWHWNREQLGGRNDSVLVELHQLVDAVSVSKTEDKKYWILSPHSGYSVSNTRRLIDDVLLPSLQSSTRWSKSIPKKVNIFLWRLSINRLPTRWSLVKRGVEIGDIGCPHCTCGLEDESHIMFTCLLAKEVSGKISIWTGVDTSMFDSWTSWVTWYDQWQTSGSIKNRMNVIVAALLWILWRFRNDVIFMDDRAKKADIFDSIRDVSYVWLSSRCKDMLNWNNWLIKPL
ncbi:uncharacterized protein [Rutidosis leptorrhynchoides]|uniref:uncharacterized protein n=1 Tax=Rutidosis leptorrhynchoides TaxID=125765 RepID=UPI003A996B9D